MFWVFLIYEIFVLALSTFLAWHFPIVHGWKLALGGLFFISFNGLFFFLHLPKKQSILTTTLTVFFSFLLALVSYLTIFFIAHDFLLMIPSYGDFYFSYPLHATIGFLLICIIIACYGIWNTKQIIIKKYHLKNTKNVSIRLAFLSDLHIAPHHINPKKMSSILEQLKQEKPDFVLLGGDIIEMRPDFFTENALQDLFKNFTSSIPTIAVVGNHEYYGGSISENVKALEDSGIIVLKDAIRFIHDKNIAFIGRDDKTNPHRLPLSRLIKNIPQSVYKIVLDHDPSSLFETIKTSADLQLSGHTHNGQLFPFNLLVKYIFLNAYGYRRIHNLDSIVSSGAGIWGPHLRIGTHNEIVIIDIQPNIFNDEHHFHPKI